MKFDYHMHTILSDGKNTHEEMVLAAIGKGFDEIGFSDHFCIKQPCKWAVGSEGIAQLAEKVAEIKEKYSKQINVLFGIEVDYFNDMEEEIRSTLQKFRFDYIIGSLHFLDGWNYDTDKSRYAEFSNDYLYDWYFSELQKAARSGLFDYMGHPDLIKKFEIWPASSPSALFEETALVFKKSGVAYELNTSGKDRPCAEFFPGVEFMKALFKAGVPVTIGSDSHMKEQLGRHFHEAESLLREAGYTEITRFHQRIRTSVSI